MSIDVFQETVFSFAEATRRLPKGCHNKKLHVSVLYRWVNAGLRSKDGQVIRLEMVKLGGRVATTGGVANIRRYLDVKKRWTGAFDYEYRDQSSLDGAAMLGRFYLTGGAPGTGLG